VRAIGALLAPLVLTMAACVTPPSARGAHENAPKPGASAAADGWAEAGGGEDGLIFLLLGQSNMVGAPKPEAEDEVGHPRVLVLAYDDCPRLGRVHDRWYPARPPLHGCGDGVGPGDAFGRALAEAYPDATVGLVPLGISGVDIDFFRKGVISRRRHEFRIPPDDHWPGAYEWAVERARLAQQAGPIRGILLHQGESDTGDPQWVGKVAAMVADLRADLGLGAAPFVAGELLYSGCCGGAHNPLVAALPGEIPACRVVSASGLAGMDAAHFDLPGQRELGARYGAAMLELLAEAPPGATASPGGG